MSILCRDATVADLPAIDRIYRESFCDTFAHLYRDEDLQSFLAKFTPEAWRSEFEDPRFAFRVVEEEDGQVFGYLKLGPLALPVEPGARPIELRQLYLLKGHHGSGAAAQLMQWALSEARRRGAEEMYLSVFTENYRAKRFYERYGFEFVCPYHFMVGNQADEDIILKKVL